MSASEALTIWMLRTAMKAPSVAPITAIQVFAEIAGVAAVGAAFNSPVVAAEAALMVGWKRGHVGLLLLGQRQDALGGLRR
jgi:hypothetical protein